MINHKRINQEVAMSSLTYIEKTQLEEMLGMVSGYVLDFSDRTYADFFRDAVKININDQKYSVNGASKAKRLRVFWNIESDPIVGKVVEQLLAVWLHKQPDRNKAATDQDYVSARKTVLRLSGKDL